MTTRPSKATIAIVGLWHQGTVLAACFAEMGHTVRGTDPDGRVVAGLREAQSPVHEPDLDALLTRGLRSGRLMFTTDLARALHGASFIFISLDTPMHDDDEPDLEPVFEAARRVARALSSRALVVVTSQVPVGTCERLRMALAAERPRAPFDLAYVPEFLRLGVAIETFRRADRFVIGADAPPVARRVAALYAPLRRPLVLCPIRTAEMAKAASNAFLALSISAINEFADLCDRVGADVIQVAEIMKLDPRIGSRAYLTPGLGFAGGTLGRDVRGVQGLGREHRTPTRIMDAVMEVNGTRPALVGRRLEELYGSLSGRTVAVFGLTYKPGTSTLRRSTGLDIVADLAQRGAAVRVYDPLARLRELDRLPPFTMASDPYGAADGADALVLVTPWDGLERLSLSRLRRVMRRPVLLDTRNYFDPARLYRLQFEYMGIGRGSPQAGKGGG